MTGTMKGLAHPQWDCKYHVDFLPKYRRKTIYGELRKMLGERFHDLARQKEYRIIEGHLLAIMCICVSKFRPSMQWPR